MLTKSSIKRGRGSVRRTKAMEMMMMGMETMKVVVLPILLLIIILGVGGFLRRSSRRPLKPPSPSFNLPFLGHIHILPRFFSTSFVLHHSRILGPLFSLRFGSVTSVFVTSAPLIQKALLHHGPIFSSRVQSPAIAVLNYNFRDINSSNGPFWRSARKNVVLHTLSPPSILAFRPSRQRSHDFILDMLRRGDAATLGAMTVFRLGLLHSAVSMCFGFPIDDQAHLSQISSTLDELAALFFPLAFSDFYPFLRPLIFYALRNKTRAFQVEQRRLLLPLLEMHRQKTKLGAAHHLIPGNYVETLFRKLKESPATDSAAAGGGVIGSDDILPLTSEFLEVNVTTVATCLEWTMARLVKHPSVQEKLYSHIREVVGDRPVEEDDLPDLPYLQAVMMESLRMHPPLPILLPRETTQRCELGGYEIPAGSVMSFCVAAVAMDPEVWEDPEEFKPERMMGLELDLTGTKKVTMLPFGAGRRYCPGMAVARTNVQMVVARAVQEFEWLPSDQGVDMSECLKLTTCMARPLRPILRSRTHRRRHLVTEVP